VYVYDWRVMDTNVYTYDWRVIIMLDLPMCTSVCMCVWERCVGIIGIYEVVVFFVYTYV